MNPGQDDFDAARFAALLEAENWLGAWSLLKSQALDRAAEGARVGELAGALQRALTAARAKDDREKVNYLRAVLAWALRDYPGLAALYREQARPASLPGVPDGLQELWRDFNDILAGRKGLDEEFRERMRTAAGAMNEQGFPGDELRRLAREAEREIQRGVAGLKDFLGGLWGAAGPGADAGRGGAADGEAPTGGAETGAPGAGAADADQPPPRRVKIEDADAPLPHETKKAPPSREE